MYNDNIIATMYITPNTNLINKYVDILSFMSVSSCAISFMYAVLKPISVISENKPPNASA